MMKLNLKKNKADAAPLTDEQQRTRRKKRKRLLGIGAAAILLALTLILALLPDAESSTGGSISAAEEVIDVTVDTGDIDSIFRGSGVLTDGEAQQVELQSSVELLYYTVRSGDAVAKGDVLACVDKSAAQVAAAELQAAMDTLDSQIADAESDAIASTLSAPAAGRVKMVYARPGDAVADVMYDDGALLLLSLDGLMAVDFESEAKLSIGDSLTVTLADGSEEKGRVAQGVGGKYTVTFDDETALPGDSVTVSDGAEPLAQGEAYVHSALKLTGFTGTVSSVYVSEGQSVYSGQTLLTLTDTAYSGRYQSLIKQRSEYASQLKTLTAACGSGYIYAPCDGVVSGISSGAEYSPLASVAETGGVTLLRDTGETGKIVLLSADPTATPEPTPASTPEPTPTVTPSPTPSAAPSPSPSASPAPSPSPAPVEKYIGKVTGVSYGSLSVLIAPAASDADASVLTAVSEDTLTQSAQYSPGSGTPVYIYENGASVSAALSDIRSGDLVLFTFEQGVLTRIDCLHSQSSGGSGPSGGGSSSGMPATGGGSAATVTEAETYTLSTTVVCELIPTESMTLTVSVDELDVLSIAVGQQAEVMLDSVSGQSFSAQVTGIDPVGVSDTGSTKYSVTLRVERTALMLSGMNASAYITVGQVRDVLLLPAAAVYEDGGRKYVYTGYNSKKDQLLDPVDVTTGATDGESVEILSGVASGTKIYYKYAATLIYSY